MLGYMCVSEPYIRTAYHACVYVGAEEGTKKKIPALLWLSLKISLSKGDN